MSTNSDSSDSESSQRLLDSASAPKTRRGETGAKAVKGTHWHRNESIATYKVVRKLTVSATTTMSNLHNAAIVDYVKVCRQLVDEGLWLVGAPADKIPTVDASIHNRTSGNKEAVWKRGTKMRSQVVNLVTGTFHELFPSGKLPSGVLADGALEMVRAAYYLRSLTTTRLRKLKEAAAAASPPGDVVMPENFTDAPFEIFRMYGPTVLGGLGDAGLLIQAADSKTEKWDLSRAGQKKREKMEGRRRLIYVCNMSI
jgi:hypothetical protein